MLTALASIFGLVGLGGVSLLGLGSMGLGGGLIAWFAAKGIPWKTIAVGAIALFIGLSVFAGYETFKATQAELIKTKTELSTMTMLHGAEKKRADTYAADHDAQVDRIQTLEASRAKIHAQATMLNAQLLNMTVESDFNNDAAKAIAGFNDRNGELNRLLDAASRGDASNKRGATGPGKAGATGTVSPLQRALQGLWKDGVPVAK